MKLRSRQQQQRDDAFCNEGKMKGPEKAGDDEQPGQGKNKMENRTSPESIDAVTGT